MEEKQLYADLYYQEGGSDKVYKVSLNENLANTWNVTAEYGRRGAALTTTIKASGCDYSKALKVFESTVKEKQAKGYKGNIVALDGSVMTTAAPVSTSDKVDTDTPVQLSNAITLEEVEVLIANKSHIMQEKKDGVRRLLIRNDVNEIFGVNRKAQKVDVLTTAVGKELAADNSWALQGPGGTYCIDGEAIGDQVFAFDIICHMGKDLTEDPLSERLMHLDDILARYSNVQAVRTARTPKGKRELFDKLLAEGREGVVFKKLSSHYAAGRPSSGGDWLKYKFYNTASFMVMAINGKRSVQICLYDYRTTSAPSTTSKKIGVGNVTIPPNFEIPAVDDVIEVRYLYAYPGGSVYQPVYLGVRDDVDMKDCTLGQLKFKASDEAE